MDRLPLVLGDWTGRDVPLDKRIIEATDTDAHLSREYTKRGGGGRPVRLWIAYGVRMRDLMPHRPEVCYPGAGWTLQDSGTVEFKPGEGPARPLRMFEFSRGGLDSRGIRVLHWYLVDGAHTADVGALRSKAWKPPSKSDYVLQVQVNAEDSGPGAVSQEALLAFAAEVAPEIERLMAEVTHSEVDAAASPATPAAGGGESSR